MSRSIDEVVGALAFVALAACSDAAGPSGHVEPITELPRALSVGEQALVGASNRFTVDFRLANAIFHRNEFQMEAPFLDDVRTYFDGEVEGLDFDDPGATDHIDTWVQEATADRIQRIVDPPIDPATVAFLMNAIYFKGDWTREFASGEPGTHASTCRASSWSGDGRSATT